MTVPGRWRRSFTLRTLIVATIFTALVAQIARNHLAYLRMDAARRSHLGDIAEKSRELLLRTRRLDRSGQQEALIRQRVEQRHRTIELLSQWSSEQETSKSTTAGLPSNVIEP